VKTVADLTRLAGTDHDLLIDAAESDEGLARCWCCAGRRDDESAALGAEVEAELERAGPALEEADAQRAAELARELGFPVDDTRIDLDAGALPDETPPEFFDDMPKVEPTGEDMPVVGLRPNEVDLSAALANVGVVAEDPDEASGTEFVPIALADTAHKLAQNAEDEQPLDNSAADVAAVEVVDAIRARFPVEQGDTKAKKSEPGAGGLPEQFWTIVEQLSKCADIFQSFTTILEGNDGSKIGIVTQQRCKLLVALEKDPFRQFPSGVQLARQKFFKLVQKHLASEKLLVAASVMHVNGIDPTWPDTYPTSRYVNFCVLPWIEDQLKRVLIVTDEAVGPSGEDEREMELDAAIRGKTYEPKRPLTAVEQFRSFLSKKAEGSIRGKQYDASPAEWWRTIGRQMYPGVFACAIMLLSFECTSVRVESSFSIMHCMQGLHRTSLVTRNIEALMMVRLNARRIARLVLDDAAIKHVESLSHLGWS
jgi:hypothetical protein